MKKIPIEYQQRLAELNLYKGLIDGWHGSKTRSAIRAFQRINGLKVDGVIGKNTLAMMYPDHMPERDKLSFDTGPGTWPHQRDVISFYGNPGTNHTTITLPYTMKIAWDKRLVINSFIIHEKCHDSAKRCFDRIANAYDADQRRLLGIDLFGGCYNKRKMRGGSRWSMHAFACAIDFDPARNTLYSTRKPSWTTMRSDGTKIHHIHARLSDPDANEFWRIWEDEDWLSLGRARDFDWMHIQAARL